jgi:hypothetical protein
MIEHVADGGIYDTLAAPIGTVRLRDYAEQGGRLELIFSGVSRNLSSGSDSIFYGMIYNDTALTPWIKYLVDTNSGSAGLAWINGNTIFGHFTSINGIPATNLIQVYTDTTAPTLLLLGNDTVTTPRDAVYTDAGVSVNDNVDPAVTTTVYLNTVNISVEGTYQYQYSAVDHTGNVGYSAIRTVIVTHALGISEIGSNPSIDIVQSRAVLTGFAGTAIVTVYDIQGQVVHTEKFDRQATIDMRDYASGIYSINIGKTDTEPRMIKEFNILH